MKIPKSNKNTLKLEKLFETEFFLKEVFIGKILGDGHLTDTGNFRLTHSVKQKEYVEHCYNLYLPFIKKKTGLYSRVRYKDTIRYEDLSFMTCAVFKNFMPLFYKIEENKGKINRIKIIPQNLKEYFTEVSLAYWIMDDGFYLNKTGICLCTHSYSLEEVEFLKEMLQEKLNIISKIIKTKRILKTKISETPKEYRFLLKLLDVSEIWEKVKNYIHPTMYYKFGK